MGRRRKTYVPENPVLEACSQACDGVAVSGPGAFDSVVDGVVASSASPGPVSDSAVLMDPAEYKALRAAARAAKRINGFRAVIGEFEPKVVASVVSPESLVNAGSGSGSGGDSGYNYQPPKFWHLKRSR